MKITSKPLALVIIIMLFGGIAFTTTMGWWRDAHSKEPGKHNGGEQTGQYYPADIRGSYLLGDVSKNFNIPPEVLRKAFNIPEDRDMNTLPLKELETFSPDVNSNSVGLFAAFYNGFPFSLDEEPFLPPAATEILWQHNKMTAEQAAYLKGHFTGGVIPVDKVTSAEPTPVQKNLQVTSGERAVAGRTMTGTTTFQDLLDWGLPRETIEKIIGGTLPEAGGSVRLYFLDRGGEFRTYKEQLQAELDKMK